jgi:hypothetical protein
MAKATKRVAGSWRYVLKEDASLPPEQQSVFVLNPLTGAERERVADEVSQRVLQADGTVRVISRMRSIARELCLTHIASVERFPSDAPDAWPEKTADREKYLEKLSDDQVFEIGNEIYERSALGKEEAKQVGESSAPAPTSS